jgi:hypothetical protein
MSAAATAAGYLYASGRLRGRAAREQEEEQGKPEKPAARPSREKVRVAVLPAREDKPRRTPKIEYRTRKRWTPE